MTKFDMHVLQPHVLHDWQRVLHWNATSHGWIASTENFFLFVPENIYAREIKAYFISQGTERKTWSEIMRPAEEAWQRQCELEQAFRAKLEQWLSSSERGIRIIPRA